jgi:hypothetical protein
MLNEFKNFIAKGNVMDMAVGIIIGAAFTAIVTSLVNDLINPIISLFTGGLDFSGLGVALGDGEDAAVFAYGNFVMAGQDGEPRERRRKARRSRCRRSTSGTSWPVRAGPAERNPRRIAALNGPKWIAADTAPPQLCNAAQCSKVSIAAA